MHSIISQLELRLKALSFVRVADKGSLTTNDYEAHYRYSPQLPEKLNKVSDDTANVRSAVLWTVTSSIVSYGIIMKSTVDSVDSLAIIGVQLFPVSVSTHDQVDRLFLEYRLFELNAINSMKAITKAFNNSDGVPISMCVGNPTDSSRSPSNN